jgi:chromosomal replication initiation ATPase DnaA
VNRQLRLELRRPIPYRRKDFVVSATNAEAVRVLDGRRQWHAGCLALVGPEGSGKTHLARVWAKEAGAVVVCGKDKLNLATLVGRPVLLEDADRAQDDELLFHLINMAGEDGGALLITARIPPSAWPASLPDLRSRLNAMTVAELPAPDDVILEGVLRKLFRERNIEPGEDLIAYLLKRIERSGPAALAIVERLDDAAAEGEQRAVSRALARQFLEIDGQTPDLFE